MARRRLVTVAVAATLALVALAGCRSEPGSAAFVGDTRITTTEVNAVLDGILADGVKIPATNQGGVRSQVTSLLIFKNLLQGYARQQGYPEPQVDYQAAAEQLQLNLPATDPYVRLVADVTAYRDLLFARATPATVTDADYNTAADLILQQGVQGGQSQVADTIKSNFSDQLARGIAVRGELATYIQQQRVSINPLYGPATVSLVDVQGKTLMLMPLTAGGAGSPAVTDITKI